jgi:hypothetical protein
MWKKVMEKENENCKPKVEINVDMVEWDQSIVDVCDHTRSEGKYANCGTFRERGQSYKGLMNQMGESKEGSFGCS